MDLGIEHLADARVVGRGGFATVYAATDTRFARKVAVKILSDGVHGESRRRFDKECEIMGRLSSHPHVVTVFTGGYAADGRPYLVMELIEGGTLADQLVEQGPLPWREAVGHCLAVAEALAAAHEAGILHRDLKPANILLDGGTAKLTDFGIARLVDSVTLTSTHFAGSWLHIAPETFHNNRDERSDIYSLASTLHTLISGSPPFWRPGDDSLNPALFRLLHHPPPRLDAAVAPAALADIVTRTLAKDPDARPRTAREFAALLRGVLSAPRPATVRPPTATGPIPSGPGPGGPGGDEPTDPHLAGGSSVDRDPDTTADPPERGSRSGGQRPDPDGRLRSPRVAPPGRGPDGPGRDGAASPPERDDGGEGEDRHARAAAGDQVGPAVDGPSPGRDLVPLRQHTGRGERLLARRHRSGRRRLAVSDLDRSARPTVHPERDLGDTVDRMVELLAAPLTWSKSRKEGPLELLGAGVVVAAVVAAAIIVLPFTRSDDRVVSSRTTTAMAEQDPERPGADDVEPLLGEAGEEAGDEVGDDRLVTGRLGGAAAAVEHDATVLDAAALPDGRIVSAGGDGTIQVWEPDDPERHPVVFSGHTGTVWAVAALSDGRVVSAGADGTVRVWEPDGADGRPGDAAVFTGHVGPVLAVAITGDGRVVSAGTDSTVQIWDPDDVSATPVVYRGHSGQVRGLVVLRDGRVASAGTEGGVRIWNPADVSTTTALFTGHADAVRDLVQLDDGRVASAGADDLVLLWDPWEPSAVLGSFTRHESTVWAVVKLLDGRVASAGGDGQIWVWDPAAPDTSAVVRTEHDGTVWGLATLPDGRVVSSSGDGSARVWKPDPPAAG